MLKGPGEEAEIFRTIFSLWDMPRKAHGAGGLLDKMPGLPDSLVVKFPPTPHPH